MKNIVSQKHKQINKNKNILTWTHKYRGYSSKEDMVLNNTLVLNLLSWKKQSYFGLVYYEENIGIKFRFWNHLKGVKKSKIATKKP